MLEKYGNELRKTYNLEKLRRRLWDYRATARAFTPAQRIPETPYTHYELATYVSKKFMTMDGPRILTPAQCREHLENSDPNVLEQMKQLRGKPIKSLSQCRDATLYLALKTRELTAEKKAEAATPSPEVLACCHHEDVVEENAPPT